MPRVKNPLSIASTSEQCDDAWAQVRLRLPYILLVPEAEAGVQAQPRLDIEEATAKQKVGCVHNQDFQIAEAALLASVMMVATRFRAEAEEYEEHAWANARKDVGTKITYRIDMALRWSTFFPCPVHYSSSTSQELLCNLGTIAGLINGSAPPMTVSTMAISRVMS